MSDLGTILQRVGAGFQGNLAEFDMARAREEELRLAKQAAREKQLADLDLQRKQALVQDAYILDNLLEQDDRQSGLSFLQGRVGFINQLSGDPSHTQEAIDRINKGDISGLRQDLKPIILEGMARGWIKPLEQPKPASSFGQAAVDAGFTPGTPEFAAFVLQQMAPKAEQPRMVEQNGIQYWAEGPNAGKPVVAGAGAAQMSPVEQFTKRFGPIEAGKTPEVVNGAITGRLVPIEGSKEDPKIIKAQAAEKLRLEAPGAFDKLQSATSFLDNVLNQINSIESNNSLNDVLGSLEGRDSMFGGSTALDAEETQAVSDINTLNNMLQVQGLQTMRDESKTGGAVGSVTENEWPKLSARYGNMERVQREDKFKDNLKRLKQDITAMRDRVQNAYKSTYGDVVPQSQQQGAASNQPSPAAVMALQANPNRASEFDAKYGRGASARYLQRMAPMPRGGV